MVVLIIEPDDHGGIFGQRDQQVIKTPHTMAPEHVDLVPEYLAVNDLGIAGSKNTVPKQTPFLQQRGRCGDHAVQPVLPIGPRPHHAGLLVVKAPDHIIPHPLRIGGIDQRLHCGVVALGRIRLELRTGGAETGAAYQMCDQCHVVCTHLISLSLLSVLMPVQGAVGFRFGAGEVGKASLASIIRDVSPFVQVSVRAYMALTYPAAPVQDAAGRALPVLHVPSLHVYCRSMPHESSSCSMGSHTHIPPCTGGRACSPASRYDNASSSALASCKSVVSNPSVNQP